MRPWWTTVQQVADGAPTFRMLYSLADEAAGGISCTCYELLNLGALYQPQDDAHDWATAVLEAVLWNC